MNISIKNKLLLMTAGTAFVSALTLIILLLIQMPTLKKTIISELDVTARDNVAQISEDVYAMAASLHRSLSENGVVVNDPLTLPGLRERIEDITVGQSGYVFIIGGSGDWKGHYVVSKGGARDGENIWNAKDANGVLFIQDMVNQSTSKRGGQVSFIRYPWQNKGETTSRAKISAVTYFEPWDWVIGAGTYEDEFYATAGTVQASFMSQLWLVIGIGLVIVLIGSYVAFRFGTKIANHLRDAMDMASRLANGEAADEIHIDSNDELGQLGDTFNLMSRNIQAKSDFILDLANGKLESSLELASDHDTMGKALHRVRDAVVSVTTEINELAVAAIGGRLNERADSSKFTGDYNLLISRLNKLISTLVGHIDSLPMPIAIMNTDLEIQFINQAGAALGNKRPEELGGTQCRDFFCSEDCGTDNCAVKRSMQSKKVETSNTIARPAGKKFDISYSGNPILDESGNVVGSMEVVVDQTDVLAAQRLSEKINGYQKTEITKLRDVFYAMAGGDMTTNYAVGKIDQKEMSEVGDSFEEIASVLNQTLSSMNDILSQVGTSIDEVRSGAEQVSAASQSLSQGATIQASSLEEISSTVTEIAGQTKNNSDNAVEASNLAKTASNNAGAGNERMDEMLESMKRIESQSLEVQKIIKVIDEIAFQTNLLALNAAVEAARAGVHGKGFAVVAEEVRNLAQRSARAASETTELIENSVTSVKEGSEIADDTAKSFRDILNQIDKVTNLVTEISDASRDQSAGISQVNDALGQVDVVTQGNTANAEESAAAAEELSGQSEQLRQMMSRFKLTRASSSNHLGRVIQQHVQGGGSNGHDSPESAAPRHNVQTDVADRPSDVINLDDDDFSNF
jgi:methyl-accepting chemotaxis protein